MHFLAGIQMLLIQILFFIPPLLIAGALFHLALRFVRAFERRGTDQRELQALQERLDRLGDELGRTAGQVERLEEGQRFMQRLLAERGSGVPPVT